MSSTDDQNVDPASQLTNTMLEELQLNGQPFSTSTASGGSFLDEIAEAQLDDIKQALISGDDLLLILGPEGSGKSTLLTQLGANSGQRIQCFSVHGGPKFSTVNLFAGMLDAFKKEPPKDLKLMLDDLIPCLQGMADHNTLGAVVLDDADQIPEAELTKLLSGMLYINSSNETLLRVTLAAATEFEERIPELLPEGADLPYSSLAIEAFDKERSANYLHYRLSEAGYSQEFPFTEKELASINQDAGGRPGALHAVAAHHLNARDEGYEQELPPELAAAGTSKRTGKGGFGGLKLLAGAAALLMIFAGLFLLKPETNNVNDDRYTVVEKKKLDTAKKEQELKLLAEQKDADAKAAAEKLAEEKAAAEKLAEASANTEGAATNAEAQATADAKAKVDAAKREAQLQAKLEKDAADKAEQEKLAKEAEAKEKAAQELAAAKLAAEKQAEEEQAAKEQAEKERLAKLAADKAATEANVNNLESPNWILTQNPALFTVQMSAATDRESVENFMARNKLEGPNSVFSFDRNGATWYALVHGLYDSIEEARQDIEKMPESARSNQPWIRAVGRIQNALKEQN